MSERVRSGEKGFALILAILSLMLLTFLGLALAASTSTELQIATNYRWSQMAHYNAEAGIEAVKSRLGTVTDWGTLLWRTRTVYWPTSCATLPCTVTSPPSGIGWDSGSVYGAAGPTGGSDAWGNPLRNYEAGPCDVRGNGVGYGVLLKLGTGAGELPMQYLTTLRGQPLNGAVTVWVRRALELTEGQAKDSADSGTMIITAEGVAPFAGETLSASTLARGNLAAKTLEFTVARKLQTAAVCGARAGQTGNSQEGSGFGACEAITGAGLTGATGEARTDTGVQ